MVTLCTTKFRVLPMQCFCVWCVFSYSNNWSAVAVFFLECFTAIIYVCIHFYFTFAIA